MYTFSGEHIVEALQSTMLESQITEMRLLNAKLHGQYRRGTISGYFDQFESIPQALEQIERAEGCYFIPNLLDPRLLARRWNRLDYAEEKMCANDGNILRRLWLLVDVDPERPAGTSSSDEEHDLAISTAGGIACDLMDTGWPEPVLADSGNGAHLMFRVELPRDDNGLVKRCLLALAARYDICGAIKIGAEVHNPARIWKLPGTLACKGEDFPGTARYPARPWRMAQLMSVPTSLEITPKERLAELAATAPAPAPAPVSILHAPRQCSGNGQFSIDAFVEKLCGEGYAIEGPKEWPEQSGGIGRRWILRSPIMCEHGGGEAVIGQMASGALWAKCHHAHCNWTWGDLRARFWPKPLSLPAGARRPNVLESD